MHDRRFGSRLIHAAMGLTLPLAWVFRSATTMTSFVLLDLLGGAAACPVLEAAGELEPSRLRHAEGAAAPNLLAGKIKAATPRVTGCPLSRA